MSKVRIYGIRHHGPGSARRLLDALTEWEPDLLLIELPADAQSLIDRFDPAEMHPPVAMLLYDPKDFSKAAYFPLAEFSPEWQALKYAADHQITSRCIDLPIGTFFKKKFNANKWAHHPFRRLAQQTDYKDTEQWWDHFMEQQPSTTGLFDSIDQLMTVLRENTETPEENQIREAFMLDHIRTAKKENHQKIAVICGAFHTPALKAHNEKSIKTPHLKSTTTEAVWIPWSYERLTQKHAYGAGVHHPGWYETLFHYGKEAPSYWVARTVSLLREKGLSISSASSVEVIRLAHTLQQLRGRRTVGLPELDEAFTAVAFEGIGDWKKQYFSTVYIGDRTGQINHELYVIPLQKDFRARLRSARLSQVLENVTGKQKTLDLRKRSHRTHSRFFYQTRFLDIPLAVVQDPSLRARGNFKEIWDVTWDPASEWTLIQAGTYGTTVESAARYKMDRAIQDAKDMDALVEYLEEAFLCGFEDLFNLLQERIIGIYSLSDSVIALLRSLETLTFADQYGDIRYDEKPELSGLIDRIGARAAYLLPVAISRLTEVEDTSLREHLSQLHSILMDPVYPALRQYFSEAWIQILIQNNQTDYYHGKALKYCMDQKLVGESFMDQQFIRHLSAPEPEQTLDWLQGLFSTHILWIAYDEKFLSRLNQWISDMDGNLFQANLPVLRKIFSQADPADRHHLFQQITDPGRKKKDEDTKYSHDFKNHVDSLMEHYFNHPS